MKIKFYAHASFRLEADGVSVVTDPYTPGAHASNFDPIREPADMVVMSSATDRFHSDPSHVTGSPIVINALEVPAEGITVKGVQIEAYPTMESLTFDFGGRDPDPNAMYLLTMGGLRVLHIGDVGNPISEQNLQALDGKVDVMFALTGGHATIALDDLDAAIAALQPRVVIPMHYYSPRGVLKILPVEEFTKRYPPEDVTYVGGSELTLTQESLPQRMHIYVLEQSR
jgi:L-ascorbate metabolism protein UlaG (beta-lactamase superfamily)